MDFRALLDDRMLSALEREYAYPVDVEYTVQLGLDGAPMFNVVQCRTLQTLGTGQVVDLPADVPEADLLFATEGHFMGGSIDRSIKRIIRVNTERYAQLSTDRKHAVARLIGYYTRSSSEQDAEEDAEEERSILLIGPGRWGSSSPQLGVPIRFADISRVAVLVEVAEMDGRVEPDLSFGSHFFQDLVEAGIAYVALHPRRPDCRYNPSYLVGLPVDEKGADALGDEVDPETALAVEVYDVQGQNLRVRADVRTQRLLCCRVGQDG